MLGIQLLICIVLLALICVGAYFYSMIWIKLFLSNDTDALGYILDTECVPAQWSLKYAKRIEHMREKGISEAKIERIKKRADRHFQRKMKRIVAFAKGAPIFESDNHRKVTLEDLERIKGQWNRREFMYEPY